MKTIYVSVALAVLAAAMFAWGGSPVRRGSGTRWEFKELTMAVTVPKFDMSGQATGDTGDQTLQKTLTDLATKIEKDSNRLAKELQDAGHQGWELVTVTSIEFEIGPVQEYSSTIYLKRPLP